jgi:hypothetical protein
MLTKCTASLRGNVRRYVVAVVAVAFFVSLVLAGCQDLQGPDTATSATASPTTVPAQVATTQDLVRVPSYLDFESTYTGDVWEQVLASWMAAIEDGFSQAGLVADLELVAPGDAEYQDPEAGTMVPRGTVVHIRVAVYD